MLTNTSVSLDRVVRGACMLGAFLFLGAAGCASQTQEEETEEGIGAATSVDTKSEDISDYQFDLETKAGKRLFQSMRYWSNNQKDSYALPLGCAKNVAHVFGLTPDVQNAGIIAALDGSSNQRVDSLLARAKRAGAKLYVMPKNAADPEDPTPFIEKLNTIHKGRIPVGTIVAGCSRVGCTGEGGMNHAAMVGETDEDGVVWLYHNNWYRPWGYDWHETDEAAWGANWREHMVPKARLRTGKPRQWMSTPWIKITRDGSGKVTNVEGMLWQIDDLYPFGDGNMHGKDRDIYHMHLVIPKPIEDEIQRTGLDAPPSDNPPLSDAPSAPSTSQQ